jgi:prephenate dehydrogenase
VNRRIEVVGLGLMGLSLAWRLHEAGWEVYGTDRDPAARRHAEALGIRPRPAPSPAWVVLAVPLAALPAVVKDVAARAAPGAVITDLTSVKRPVMPILATLPDHFRVVSSHPMAGSEQGGHQAARPDLYAGRIWAMIPVPGREVPRTAVAELTRPLGVRLTELSADEHDAVAAVTSHLPYVLSLALAEVLAQGPTAADRLVGPAALAATRTAASPPELWAEILEVNRDQVVAALETMGEALDTWRTLIKTGSREQLTDAITRARAARATLTPPSA